MGQGWGEHWHLWMCSSCPGILKANLQSGALSLDPLHYRLDVQS